MGIMETGGWEQETGEGCNVQRTTYNGNGEGTTLNVPGTTYNEQRITETGDNRPGNWREAVDRHFNTPVKQEEPKFGHMTDVIDWLEERKAAIDLPSKEDLEKEKRRQKTEGIVSSVSDMARALTNLFATSQYAPNAYDGQNTMTARMQERFDKLKAERDADEQKYYNYAMAIGQLKNAHEATQYQRGRDALADRLRMNADERAELKGRYEEAKAQAYTDYMLARGDKAGYEAEVARLKAEYEPQRQALEQEKAQAYTRYQNERSRGGSGNGSGKGKGSQGYYTDTVIERDKEGKEIGRHVDRRNGTRPKKPTGLKF